MFMRLIILESGRNAMWIKIVGVCLIIVRFADWPYELAVREVDNKGVTAQDGYCWAQWEMNVLILNFVGDALANLFLSGMFVRRLYKHISSTKNTNTPQNQMIEHIARKSLVCLILTFFVNLTMNVLKVTSYLGTYSDAFTVYFELVESTLLVEALRVDEHIRSAVGCSHCGKSNGYIDPRSDKDGLHGTSHKRSKFTSFDFMPLEERQANSDPFKRSPSVDQQPASATAHHATSAQHATSAATDPTRRLASMDSVTTNLFSSTATPTSETTKIGSRPSEDYNFMTSPLTSRKVLSSQQQSSSQAPTAPTPALRSASPPSAYPPTYNQANVMDTYSRPLIHHREWHNDDYKMF
ncbi:hypothetical protein BC940DRAFT_126975 [Gongronella butleri]|nr:hypothetical protein BC940DRAFT_126975 [Gongronella butleri]